MLPKQLKPLNRNLFTTRSITGEGFLPSARSDCYELEAAAQQACLAMNPT